MDGPDLTGRRLGRFEILERIGAGGMGVVYRARDSRLHRDVAIKVLPHGTLADAEARRRFQTEALTLSRLNHPHIAVIHDFSTQDDTDFLVMELIQGDDLAARLARGPLDEAEAARLGIQVAGAIQEAHEAGVIHRDLKPANVVLTPRGQAKVLDFGLAHWSHGADAADLTAVLTDPGSVSGTLPYMAPEQLRGKEVDARADIYALGALLYEAVTGERPFPETVQADLVNAILNRPPVPARAVSPAVSADLERVILKCMEKDRELRYQSARELEVDLRRLASSSSVSAQPLPVPSGRRSRRQVLPWAAGAIAVLVAAAVFLLPHLRSGGPGAPGGPGKAAGPSAPTDSLANVLVVLPFENLGSEDDQYFADGITEEITSRLARIPGLKIISRTSALHYARENKSLKEIGEELGVGSVLEGTIRTDRVPGGAGSVRVTPQLIRVKDDTHLWAEEYTAGLVPGQIFDVQARIAEQVAQALHVTLLASDRAAIEAEHTQDAKAYDQYLLGRYYWNRRTKASLLRAAGYFEQATGRDPKFARAYAGLADTYVLFPVYQVPGTPARTALQRAEAAARQAIVLDSTQAEAHASLGLARLYGHYDFAGAETEFRRAITLDPDYPVAHYWYSELLGACNQPNAAVAQAETAVRLDPSSPIARHLLGAWLRVTGRTEEALVQAQKAVELEPKLTVAHGNLAAIYLAQGRFEDAYRELVKSGDPPPVARIVVDVLADSLTTKEGVKQLHELAKSMPPPGPAVVAYVMAWIGAKDEAFQALEQLFRERGVAMIWLRVWPGFEDLRGDPRYDSLVKRVGLDYTPRSAQS